jgi:hypothetical protein
MNIRDENNKPIVAPDKNAPFVKVAFEEMATGNFTQEEVRQRLTLKVYRAVGTTLIRLLKIRFTLGGLLSQHLTMKVNPL